MKKPCYISLIIISFLVMMSCAGNGEDYKLITADEKNIPIRYKIPEETYFLEEIHNPYLFKYNVHDECFYIPDLQNSDIKVYSKDFRYIRTIGEKGQGPGEFDHLNSLTSDKNNRLFVLGKNRLQIIDDQGNYISSFWLEIRHYSLEVLSNTHLISNPDPRNELFTVMNREGKIIKRFGKLIRTDNDHAAQTAYNVMNFDVDNDDSIYCSFLNNTILRKYDNEFNLVFEIDISGLSEIRESYNQWNKEEMPEDFFLQKERWDEMHSRNIFYTRDIAVDDKYIYLVPGYRGGGTVIMKFDKNSGQLIEKIGIIAFEGVYGSIDGKSDNYLHLYVFNKGSLPAIVKIRKN
ncbi:MAG: 6-bladed beta-propeller [bacterium]|nr:6-bladed beta-propeller [bacterium]